MQIVNGSYRFSGEVEALEIVEQYGCPLYVYDYDIIERQYKRLTDAFSGVKLKINYACKSLTNVNILRLIRQLGACLLYTSPSPRDQRGSRMPSSA